MNMINLTIAVSDNHLDHILEVAQHLNEAGLNVHQIMDSIGVIMGSCQSCQISAMQHVEGVESVETEASYSLVPPHSPVQ
ncbi:MAG: ketohydroxyglutarate aldolase [Cyanobacteria bacterium J06638_22]